MATIIEPERVDVNDVDTCTTTTCDNFVCICQGCVWDG